MIVLPEFNPNMIVIANFVRIRWYGFMYLVGFFIAWLGIRGRVQSVGLSREQLLDYISFVAFGILIGGRVGYVMIYQCTTFLADPMILFAIWNGGMSFHGALLGGLVALLLFCKQHKISCASMIDLTMPVVAPGLFFGRLGNFINGELWGRVSNVPWAMVFPRSDGLPRHPSQLYEMLGEGVLLYLVMSWHRHRTQHAAGHLGAWFLLHYGWIRFVLEYFREPDTHLGFVMAGLSMGQCLCALMMISGSIWLAIVYRQQIKHPLTWVTD